MSDGYILPEWMHKKILHDLEHGMSEQDFSALGRAIDEEYDGL